MYAQDNNSLPVWSHNLSSVHQLISQPILVHFGGNCIKKGHWANECPNRANKVGPIANRGHDRNNARRPGNGGSGRGEPGRGGPGHCRLPLQAGCGGGG